MRLYLINPSNPLVSLANVKESRWNRYRVWKPLSLMVLAGLTPPEWEITIVDENLGVPDYAAMPRPDLVGITAFTSQANRAYEVAAQFRRLGVPVVMGGIHATMCLDEVMEHVDSVVTGEAEGVWPQVLEDARQGRLQAPVRRRARRHDRCPAGPARPAVPGVRLRRHPDHARLSAELQLLQRDGLQRRPLPPATHSGRRAGVPVDPREAVFWSWTTTSSARAPSTSPAPRTCSAPWPRRTCARNGSPRPPSTSPTTRNCWRWPRRPGAAASSSALSPPRRKGSGRSARSSTF